MTGREGKLGWEARAEEVSEHHSEVPDTLCWRDLISQDIDREVREELVMILWGAYENELSFVWVKF